MAITSVSYVMHVGLMLDALEKNGMRENMIVIAWAITVGIWETWNLGQGHEL